MDFPTLETVELEKLLFGAQIIFDDRAVGFAGLTIEETRKKELGQSIYQLRAYVWSHDLEEYEFIEWVSLWDHFKARFFPKWLLMRYPARRRITKFSAKAIYPELTSKFKLPDEQSFCKVVKSTKVEDLQWKPAKTVPTS